MNVASTRNQREFSIAAHNSFGHEKKCKKKTDSYDKQKSKIFVSMR